MKILFANSTRTWGGVKSWTLRVIRALTEKGHSVSLVARGPEAFIQKAKEAGAQAFSARFGMDYGPLAVARACRRLKSIRPDVVITNISKEVRTYGVAAGLLGIPVVARLGSARDLPDNRRIRFDYRRLVAGVVVPSHAVKRDLPPRLVSPEKVRVIHNGVAVQARKAGPGKVPAPVCVVCVGKIQASKGTPVVCRAARELLDRGIRAEFVFAGEGGLRQGLMAEYRDCPGIRFPGHLPSVETLLRAADVGVLHSESEGFPNAVLEYMAHGLAVVATPVGGVEEMVSPSEAFLTPFGDQGALSAALEKLIADSGLRERMGEAARLRAEREFEIGRQTDKLLEYLKGIASKPC